MAGGVDCMMWIVGSSERGQAKDAVGFPSEMQRSTGLFYVSTNGVLEIYADEGLTTSSQM